MSEDFPTQTALENDNSFNIEAPVPVLLLAHGPSSAQVDRLEIRHNLVVGRANGSDLHLSDSHLSSTHFRIFEKHGEHHIEDLESSNGTFLGGEQIDGIKELQSSDVIRAGRCIFVFVEDGKELLQCSPNHQDQFGMAGKFHSPLIASDLEECAHSMRHLLLSGPSGAGKELAVQALRQVRGELEKKDVGLIVHNAARFSSDEEAATTLFGVASKVFSGVEARAGLIEHARNGILFLDEVHNLPERVQRSLLRVIEDGESARIGEAMTKKVSVQFVLATNDPGPTHGLAHDLFARLRVVDIPSLADRVADIPNLFDTLLSRTLFDIAQLSIDPKDVVSADSYEALCLDGFRDKNIRSLLDLADRIATRVLKGDNPSNAVGHVFGKHFSDSPVAHRRAEKGGKRGPNHYELQKELIISVYREKEQNLSAVERELKKRGLKCSRRWLRHYLSCWGEYLPKRAPKQPT